MSAEAKTGGLFWPDEVNLCEVGPRDGLQNEPVQLSVEQRVELIERMQEAGARAIEIGSFVSPKAVPQMVGSDEVMKRLARREGVEYRGLAMNLKGVERAIGAGVTKVRLTCSASRTHCLKNMNRTPEEAVRAFVDCVNLAVKHGMALSGGIATAFGCPFEGRVPLEQSRRLVECYLDMGIREISLADTSGMADPRQVYGYMSELRAAFPQVTWLLHLHDTRGMAMANILAGMQAGVTVFDTAFAGLGGCPFAPGATGNVATEDVVFMLAACGVRTGLDLDAVLAVGRDAARWLNREPGSFQLRLAACQAAKA